MQPRTPKIARDVASPLSIIDPSSPAIRYEYTHAQEHEGSAGGIGGCVGMWAVAAAIFVYDREFDASG
jgi:hypothetical protein